MTICSSKHIVSYRYPRRAHVMHNMVQWNVHARVAVARYVAVYVSVAYEHLLFFNIC